MGFMGREEIHSHGEGRDERTRGQGKKVVQGPGEKKELVKGIYFLKN